jgi:hypothetical protein
LEVKFRGTVLVIPPPVALTVSFEVPTAVPDALVRVKVLVPFPGAATLCGLKLALIPEGNPDTERATAELKPPSACVVRVTDTFPLAETDAKVVLPDKVKPGTFTVSGAVCLTPPPLAVTTSEYAPGATLDAAESVSLLVPEPGAAKLAGERLAVIPLGNPVTVSATAALNEFTGAVVRLTVVLLPAARGIELCDAARL